MPDEVGELKRIKPPKGLIYRKNFGGNRTGALVSEEGPTRFIGLTNKPFDAIDHDLGHLVSSGIETKIKENKGRKINILEIGSGLNSVASRQAGEKYGESARVVGIDLFPQNSGEGKASIIQGDMISLPFQDESFDFIFSSQTLQSLHSKDSEQPLREINRVLKPGGYSVLEWDSIGYHNGYVEKNITDLANQLGLVWKTSVLEIEDRPNQLVHVVFKLPVNEEFLAKFNEVHEMLGIKEFVQEKVKK